MAEIRLRQLAHSYSRQPASEADYALHALEHVWEQGGAYALLGPSGCGKSTLLNIISGLLTPSHGEVLFDGKPVNQLSPQARNIAQVFQFPVVYDTMTVFDNLAFPLRNQGLDEARVQARVEEIAEVLDLSAVLRKKARNLSADEKQKVSMGRGLVRDDVSAILFDEPLTVIDPHLKWKLRRKLKQIHEQFNITMIYVTHDQLEASTFADKIAVMHGGRIVQFGTPRELFERPRHTFVGYFIGSPGMNLIEVRAEADGVAFGDIHLMLPGHLREHPNLDGTMASSRGMDTEPGKQLAAVVSGLEGVINARRDAIVASAPQAVVISVALMAGACLIAFLAFLWVLRGHVSRPLRHMGRAITAVANGDLTQPFHASHRDEIGQLIGEVENMRLRFLEMLGSIRQSTESINSASADIASGNLDLSHRTDRAAASLKATASSMDQLTGTLRQSADAARTASALAPCCCPSWLCATSFSR